MKPDLHTVLTPSRIGVASRQRRDGELAERGRSELFPGAQRERNRVTPIFAPLAIGIPGQAGTTSFTETNAARLSPLFYRVGVGN